ncbi:Uncharacterised protein [Enterobacter cloacae]|nr:Uncharacterised protein [Enterobacter cloacae]
MAFCRQVHNRIRFMLSKNTVHSRFITNIRMLKHITFAGADIVKGFQVTGIRQFIQVDDFILGIGNNMSYNR